MKNRDKIRNAKDALRPKEYFYAKSRNTYGFSIENVFEDSPGYSIHWLDQLPHFLSQEYGGERKVEKYFENSYIFENKTQSLFYVNNGNAEKIEINDSDQFKKLFLTMMEDKKYRYQLKRLTDDQFHQLVIVNSNHTPTKKIKKSFMQLMRDLFPSKKSKDSNNNDQNQQIFKKPSPGSRA